MDEKSLKLTEPINKVIDFLSDIIKPPIKEISEILTDKVRYFRFKNQLELIQKAEKYVKEKGFNPKKIPLKTLVPLLENSSLEEDESLKDMWTKLLINAIDPRNEFSNHIVFIEIIKQISPLEAVVLKHFYENSKLSSSNFRYIYSDIQKIQIELNITSKKDCFLILENLTRLQLIEPNSPVHNGKGFLSGLYSMQEHHSFRLTYLGKELIEQTT